jgi:hypothetical protein
VVIHAPVVGQGAFIRFAPTNQPINQSTNQQMIKPTQSPVEDVLS